MTTTAYFRKSWGAEPVDNGFEFRLWAPSQEQVSLRHGRAPDVPMEKDQDGWFSAIARGAREGEPYSFVLSDGTPVPDPAARAQIGDVHGPSRLVDPRSYEWKVADWKGRPWEETVFYELHTGTFSDAGGFDGIARKLDYLADLGVTALELLPIAQFGGTRGWGYDGVLLYGPHIAYGGPEALKQLVDAAHERGLMIFLDVVYNHFGPDGNYLNLYAPDFFHPEHHTPWGAAIAYEKKPVRTFFIENALYWLQEYRIDGLRLDAVNHIADQSEEPLLEELAATVRSVIKDRHVHLTTEDDRNITSLHQRDEAGHPVLYSGEWNDDVHHAAHVFATGENEGYYRDYVDDPVSGLARALSTGYIYQGEPSIHWEGKVRGEPSAELPPSAFVDFLQNHDQVGNRAFGERLATLGDPHLVDLLTEILLLSPHIPLLFMGEEWGETRPFNFFTDFHGELGELVREGRRKEFAKWSAFANEEMRQRIPDPNAESTFAASKLDWSKIDDHRHKPRLDLVRGLLSVRQAEIAPRIARISGNAGEMLRISEKSFRVVWKTDGGETLTMIGNLGEADQQAEVTSNGRLIYATRGADEAVQNGHVPAHSVVVLVENANGR